VKEEVIVDIVVVQTVVEELESRLMGMTLAARSGICVTIVGYVTGSEECWTKCDECSILASGKCCV
jgi:hypothetical protein